jgi:hypothetical protein
MVLCPLMVLCVVETARVVIEDKSSLPLCRSRELLFQERGRITE